VNDAARTEPDGSSVPPPGAAPELARGSTLDRYVILKRIGRGGMGIVYLAFDGELERRVAIKVIRPEASDGTSTGSTRTRLLREAQAMAKVSHPNVVTVFDVGTFGDEVFLAMEYVAGGTLREWRSAAPRSPRAILDAYLQAGRGLEAAHAVGILHRDFKPDNVLVDERGQARVLDFGLARLEGAHFAWTDSTDSKQVLELFDTAVARSGALATPLTHTGALMGTPAYMAPELFRGKAGDARTDQYAFCAALWEAFYGQLPFVATDVTSLLKAVTRGERSEPRDRRGVSRGLHRVLLRGTALERDDRFPSMTELLHALEHARGESRRTLVWLVGGAVAASVVAGGLALRSSRPDVCAGADAEIAGAWGDASRAAVTAAFAKSGSPRASDAAARVDKALTEYARSWAAMRTESCQATRVRGVQSDEAFDLRASCLDQRKNELGAVAGLLANADEALVTAAATVVTGLSPLDVCTDVPSLRAPYAMPHDPAQRKIVESLRTRLATTKALVSTRRLDEATVAVTSLLNEPEVSSNRQLHGAALLLRGNIEGQRGEQEAGFRTLLTAAADATASRDDVTASLALVHLVRIGGYELQRYDEADAIAALTEGVLDRMGPSAERQRWMLMRYRAFVLYGRERYAEAVALERETLALGRRTHTMTPIDESHIEGDLADFEQFGGHLRAAIQAYEHAIAEVTAVAGEDDPVAGVHYFNLAGVQITLGDGPAALKSARRVLSTLRAGDDLLPDARVEEASALLLEGEVETARHEGEAAVAEVVRANPNGEGPKAVVDICDDWAVITLRRHLTDDALRAAERAIAPGYAATPQLRECSAVHALALARLAKPGSATRALAEASATLAAEEKSPVVVSGFERHSLVLPLLAIGESALATGDVPRAVEALERAAPIAEAEEGRRELAADVHLALARALGRAGGDVARARTLAERAAREYEETRLGEQAGIARALAASGAR
jgi:tetratricopeptide (TPR) repeat protein/predicted Ser/Thr protein kinase